MINLEDIKLKKFEIDNIDRQILPLWKIKILEIWNEKIDYIRTKNRIKI